MQVFEIWYKMLQDPEKFFRRAYDKKLSCTGLVCLLGVSADALPPTLTQSLPLVRTLPRSVPVHCSLSARGGMH